MNPTRSCLGTLLKTAGLASLMAAAPLQAGGPHIPDQSTRAMGMADAFTAGADDASAVYYNPAGLANLTAPEFIGNFYVAHGDVYYSGPGGNDTSDGRVYFIPSLYLAYPLGTDHNLVAGLGIYSPFGLGSRWGDDSPVRYSVTLAEIKLVNVNPTLAWRMNDQLSLGVGVDYFTSQVKSRSIRHPLDPNNPFGEGEFDLDADGDGWGYNLGAQYQLSERVRLGLTYRSQVNVDYEGDVELDDVNPPVMGVLTHLEADASAKLRYPASWAAGICWQATPDLRLEANAEWVQWSTWDERVIKTSGLGTITQRLDWRDSWVLKLGAEYRLNETWTLRGGYLYNEQQVPSSTADASMPAGDSHGIAIGVGYQASERTCFDVALFTVYSEKRTLDTAILPDSDYNAISTYFSVGVRHQF